MEQLRKPSWALFVVLGGYGILVACGLEKGLWIDEEFTMQLLRYPSLDQMLVRASQDSHPPLYNILLYCWSRISMNESFLRLLSSCFGFLTVLVSFRTWFWQKPPQIAILGGLLLSSNPVFLRYSHEIRGYGLVILLATMCFYYADKIIKNPARRFGYFGLGISLSLACLTKLVAIFLFLPLGLYLWIELKRTRQEVAWLKLALAFLVGGLAFAYSHLIFLGMHQRDMNSAWWMPDLSPHLIMTTMAYFLGMATHAQAVLSPWLLSGGFLLTFCLMYPRTRWRESWAPFAALLVYGVSVAIYAIVLTPIFWYRTFLPLLPLALAFFADRIFEVPSLRFQNLAKAALLGVIGIWAGSWVSQRAWLAVEESKNIAKIIENRANESARVIFFPGYIAQSVRYNMRRLSSNHVKILWEYDRAAMSKELETIPETAQLMLVLRADLSFNQKGYEELIDLLQLRFRGRDIVQYTIVSHDFFFTDDDSRLQEIESSLRSKAREFNQVDHTTWMEQSIMF